ncbi:MBL fold metallo-hydrolase [Bacillus tianshenii]|nr:MBL fold metallo-hydrolase [Bacillus tianshenii]
MFEKLAVQPVRVDLPFRLNHVNCFIGFGESGIKIMDTGLHNETAMKIWAPGIEKHLVEEIIVTHYHPDHYGYVGKLQELTGADVVMTEIDERSAHYSWDQEHIDALPDKYYTCDIPKELAEQMHSNTVDFVPLVTPHATVNRFLEEGEKIVFGAHEYEVIFTPGHSDGLVSFFNEENSVLFSTDHILPKITPNISYWFHGDPNPLKTYFQSLEKVKKLDATYVIPSHGKPFEGANQRIIEIVEHHEERLEKLLHVLEGSQTVYNLCLKLFGEQLNVHEMRFAIGETVAHLEYLVEQGACEVEMSGGKWYYRRK